MNGTSAWITGHVFPAFCALESEGGGGNEADQLKAVIASLLKDNARFMESHGSEYFKAVATGQHPRATVVTCSDSRVQIHAMDQIPDGDLFVVRNIGNQLATAEGSVEYGVRHLHTPLLIFVGHSDCGAIEAASKDYSREPSVVQRELDTIKIMKGVSNIDGVRANLNNQVSRAMMKYAKEVREGELTIVAAVYDFRNDLGRGQGKLVIVNVNGETDEAGIRQAGLFGPAEE